MRAFLTCPDVTSVLVRGYEDVFVWLDRPVECAYRGGRRLAAQSGNRAQVLARMPGYEQLREQVWEAVQSNFRGGLADGHRQALLERIYRAKGPVDFRDVLEVPMDQWVMDVRLPDPPEVFLTIAGPRRPDTVCHFSRPTLQKPPGAMALSGAPPWWWGPPGRFVAKALHVAQACEGPEFRCRLVAALATPPMSSAEVVQIKGQAPVPQPLVMVGP